MANLTNSKLYKLTAWRDNSVKIVLTVGEGSSAANPNYNKTLNFQLYDGDGLLSIPASGVDIFLAFERPDGTADLIEGIRVNESDISFPVKNTLTKTAGIVKSEIRLVSSNSIVKFYGINFSVYGGTNNSNIQTTEQFEALTRALQKVVNLTGDGTIADLDITIEHLGSNPVASGIIYDYIEAQKTTLEKYAASVAVDNAVLPDTTYRVYTNADGQVVQGYHMVIAVPATNQITQYLFAQNGAVLYRTCPASSGQQSGSWGTWAKFAKVSDLPTSVSQLANDSGYLVASDISGKANTADVYSKTAADAKFQTLNNQAQSIDSNTQTTTADAQKYPSVAAVKDFLYHNFYTETEINDLLDLVYSKTETDDLFATKANTYTKNEINTKVLALSNRLALHISVGFNANGVPVKFVNGVNIPSGAFAHDEITKIFISQDVQTISGGAFANCPALSDIYFDSTATSYDNGTIPSGVTAHTLDNYHVLNCILDCVKYLNDNKVQTISSGRLTTTGDAIHYPSVAAVKDFAYGEFYDKSEIDEELTLRTPVEFSITLDKDSWENQEQVIDIPTSDYTITENTRLVNFTIENWATLQNSWVCTELQALFDDENDDNSYIFRYVGDSGITDPPIDIEIKFILMEVISNAATQ